MYLCNHTPLSFQISYTCSHTIAIYLVLYIVSTAMIIDLNSVWSWSYCAGNVGCCGHLQSAWMLSCSVCVNDLHVPVQCMRGRYLHYWRELSRKMFAYSAQLYLHKRQHSSKRSRSEQKSIATGLFYTPTESDTFMTLVPWDTWNSKPHVHALYYCVCACVCMQ